MKVQAIAALAGVALTSGCVVAPAPYPAYEEDVVVAPSGVVVAQQPPPVFYEPNIVIVENGIRHDRFFYQRYPDVYYRDRARYPDRFRHAPPVYHHPVPVSYRPGPVPHYPKPFVRPGPIAVPYQPAPVVRPGDYNHHKPNDRRDDHYNPQYGKPYDRRAQPADSRDFRKPQDDPRSKKRHHRDHDDDDRH